MAAVREEIKEELKIKKIYEMYRIAWLHMEEEARKNNCDALNYILEDTNGIKGTGECWASYNEWKQNMG